MKAYEWIDRVKAARQIESDYGASKALGLSRQSVSDYRSKGTTFDEDTAIKVAQALDVKPEIVLLDQVLERTKNDQARTALSRVLKRLGGVAAGVAVVAVVAAGAANPLSAQAKIVAAAERLCITLSKRRKDARSALDSAMRAMAGHQAAFA